MRYEEILPSPHLRKYIKCFWELEQNMSAAQNTAEPVLPDGCFELIFNLSDKFRRHYCDGKIEIQPQTIIVGQMSSYVTIEPTGKVFLFGVRFQQAGAFPFFKFPLSQVKDKIESLDSIWGKDGRYIEEQVNEAQTLLKRISILENILTKFLLAKNNTDEIIDVAAKSILNNQGIVSIENLANKLDISWRQFERKFNQKVGLSPKLFCRIIRLQSVLYTLKKEEAKSLIDVALSFGYYDQSHLINEFKKFSGKSPVSFLEDNYQISEHFMTD